MSNARSRKLRGSLGDSWGDADYESDEGASIHSASDFRSDSGSETEILDNQDIADKSENKDVPTPLPTRMTRASSQTPQGTPVKTPVNRVVSRHSQSPRTTPKTISRSGSLEPSFIMPSMSGSIDGFYNGSPLQNSQMRMRKSRRSSNQSQNFSNDSSPRFSGRRISAQSIMSSDEPEPAQDPWVYLGLLCNNVLFPLLLYLVGVVKYALETMKPLFGILLIVLLAMFALSKGTNLIQTSIQTSIRTALSPLCIVPGSSYIFPSCATPSPTKPQDPSFEDLMNVQSAFEDVLQSSMDGFSLPTDMKRSEASIRDLNTLVRYSKLPSKSELEVEFQIFIESARQAALDLTKYNSRIGHTIDKVISTNRWTITMLNGMIEKAASTGALGRFVSSLNPINSFTAPEKTLQEKVFDQYIKHVSANSEDIGALIQQADSLLRLLNNLEERLDIIAQIAARDGLIVSGNHDELLSQLWTKLGGNARDRKKLEEQLSLLKQVGMYRKVAWSHVTATLLKLQSIAAGLENLRDRVAAPEVVGWREDVPLAYHVEVIERGVDRLREVRGETRRLEHEGIRKILDGADEKERGLPGTQERIGTVYSKSAT
ncbi:hypothetical protein K469DRAFT_719561 [Zopfia rhizophila CBS 207.26]|uniref:Uncharacterized protein n=1 Tax=Zopfia rhizophila CBS 207.26 TaxID=1314779 RepID=A0A6A6DDS9_9PEZI|nr:hypothetical protein K469DRAFT_719561 [Zopfia rhizophila CBS 207.26]